MVGRPLERPRLALRDGDFRRRDFLVDYSPAEYARAF
jgi:hypothetical protein